MIQSITGCARCHSERHDNLEFKRFVHPIEAGQAARLKDGGMVKIEVNASHWATCPVTGDPILLLIVPDGD